MIHSDYIMRMIEQMSAVLAWVAGFRQKKELEECYRFVNETLKDLFGLDAQSVRVLSYKDLMELAGPEGEEGAVRCAMLGRLLKEQAALMDDRGDTPGAAGMYMKSLAVLLYAEGKFEEIEIEGDIADQVGGAIDELAVKLAGYELSDDITRNLFLHHEASGNFAKAEDLLFRLIENKSAGTVEEGKAFYRRLLAKPDEELAKGNLPRDEVLEGLAELEGM